MEYLVSKELLISKLQFTIKQLLVLLRILPRTTCDQIW